MNEPLIQIENAVKTYHIGEQEFTALHGVSLAIETGAFMSVVGPSGSGKTTLLNLIGGLDVPSSGNIIFRGKNLESMSRKEMAMYRRDHVGFIFQSYNLLPVYSVYENVLFPFLVMGKKENEVRDQVMDMVQRVGLEAMAQKRPGQLSGGQCQRVAIARALVKRPSLALADEPTANLDAENSRQILELMESLNQNLDTAFVFSTHDPKVAEYVRREVRLEDGSVVEDKKILRSGT
ncbi:MAG: ABC transporter ATP-binding protein [Candidatus Nitrohelix vancouverensis]|uniref:ABC transporter ATP-binding protein n=1 Tax=Candidatus Nitrohelix vancouverensis TaxID=2705534 RepID=A0A7T0C480_9BACT|nr:MAG: ABC transporter ATP-binding protein [Candidatus Nitrohelix vancouverensis]